MTEIHNNMALQHLPSGIDPIDRLPAPAAAKLERLRAAREQASDLARAASGRMDQAKDDFRGAETAFNELQAAYRAGRVIKSEKIKVDNDPLRWESPVREVHEAVRLSPDEDRIERERKRVARLKSIADRRFAEYQRHGEAIQVLGTLCTAIESWIKAVPRNAAIVMHDGPAAKAPKGPIADAIEACRGELVAISADVLDVEQAPYPADEIHAAIARFVDALASEGAPNVDQLPDDLKAIQLPTTRVALNAFLTGGAAGMASGSLPNSVGLLAWLCRDLMVERLQALVEPLLEPDLALSADDRAQRLAELAVRRLEVERKEADLLHLADESGSPIAPRPDHDPRAFLGVTVSTEGASA